MSRRRANRRFYELEYLLKIILSRFGDKILWIYDLIVYQRDRIIDFKGWEMKRIFL